MRFCFCVFFCVSAFSCSRAPQSSDGALTPESKAATPNVPVPVVRDESQDILFSFVDAQGRMQSVPSAAAVPEAVRARVLVIDLGKTPEQRQAHRVAFFADLREKSADGSYPVTAVSRYDAVTGPPAALPAPEGAIVVYSAVWCGYCKVVKKWMDDKHVPYIERDVEKTPGASAELAAKLKAAGTAGGGIPVTDWQGTLVIGARIAELDKLLQEKPPIPQAP